MNWTSLQKPSTRALVILTAAFLVAVDAVPASTRADGVVETRGAVTRVAVEGPGRWLSFGIRNGAPLEHVAIIVDGRRLRELDVELADGTPDWWAPVDLGPAAERGSVVLEISPASAGSRWEGAIARRSGERPVAPQLYRETFRPVVHFSARRGHLNDPNGLVFYRGEYHLFFQHNPVGARSANKHWGHAVSRDLVHWTEVGEALSPDATGMMYSGSAVVDWDNTSGFGRDGVPPLVLIYTASNAPRVQCLAFSTDGRTFTKYAGNPVLPNLTSLNRDPKVFWHAPTRRWVMALYVGVPEKTAAGTTEERHTIQLFTSPNLREWKLASVFKGGLGREDRFLYECPDLFALPAPGETKKVKWVLSGGNGEYALGDFDGTTFTADATRLPAFVGRAYAGQTFNDEPQGRVVQIDWLRAKSPGMPFTNCMSVPLALSLRETRDGLRVASWPVPEFDRLRGRRFTVAAGLKRPDDNVLAGFNAEVADLEITFSPHAAHRVELNARGTRLIYDARAQELRCGKVRVPLQSGDQPIKWRVIVDRTTVEVFAAGGTIYLPLSHLPRPDARQWSLRGEGGAFELTSLEAYELRSAMDPQS